MGWFNWCSKEPAAEREDDLHYDIEVGTAEGWVVLSSSAKERSRSMRERRRAERAERRAAAAVDQPEEM